MFLDLHATCMLTSERLRMFGCLKEPELGLFFEVGTVNSTCIQTT